MSTTTNTSPKKPTRDVLMSRSLTRMELAAVAKVAFKAEQVIWGQLGLTKAEEIPFPKYSGNELITGPYEKLVMNIHALTVYRLLTGDQQVNSKIGHVFGSVALAAIEAVLRNCYFESKVGVNYHDANWGTDV